MTDPLKALFGKPDYSHIVRDTTATISITAAEMAAKWPLRGYTRAPTLRVGGKAAKAAKSAPADYCGFGVGFSGLCPPFPLPRSGGGACVA